MSETYQSKRERWQRLQENLPIGLREHGSLRNVEAVAALTSEVQQRLAEAIEAGLKRPPHTLEQLKIDPNTSIADLLNPPAHPIVEQSSDSSPEIHKELADLFQLCLPDMPRISAEALANSEVMDTARTTAEEHGQLLASNYLKTALVVVVLYGLMRQTLNGSKKSSNTPVLATYSSARFCEVKRYYHAFLVS